jgi:hypothetical protein
VVYNHFKFFIVSYNFCGWEVFEVMARSFWLGVCIARTVRCWLEREWWWWCGFSGRPGMIPFPLLSLASYSRSAALSTSFSLSSSKPGTLRMLRLLTGHQVFRGKHFWVQTGALLPFVTPSPKQDPLTSIHSP